MTTTEEETAEMIETSGIVDSVAATPIPLNISSTVTAPAADRTGNTSWNIEIRVHNINK